MARNLINYTDAITFARWCQYENIVLKSMTDEEINKAWSKFVIDNGIEIIETPE